MKVYLLILIDDFGRQRNLGIFSTEDKAYDYKEAGSWDGWNVIVQEWKLDEVRK